jgi:hypothetical protein
MIYEKHGETLKHYAEGMELHIKDFILHVLKLFEDLEEAKIIHRSKMLVTT